jgi:hypothetical protein
MSKFPAAIAAAVLCANMMTHAQSPQIDVSQLKIPAGTVIDVASPTGEIEVWVSLVYPSLGEANGRNAKISV